MQYSFLPICGILGTCRSETTLYVALPFTETTAAQRAYRYIQVSSWVCIPLRELTRCTFPVLLASFNPSVANTSYSLHRPPPSISSCLLRNSRKHSTKEDISSFLCKVSQLWTSSRSGRNGSTGSRFAADAYAEAACQFLVNWLHIISFSHFSTLGHSVPLGFTLTLYYSNAYVGISCIIHPFVRNTASTTRFHVEFELIWN